MRIKTMLNAFIMAAVMIPMMSSCSGDDSSKSPFGSLPKVYDEYLEAGNKLKEEAKNIKSEEDKAKYLKKSEELTKKWSEKIESTAKKLDGNTLNFEDGMFKVEQPISFQFNEMKEMSYLYAVFGFNGVAEASYDIVLNRNYKITSTSVKMIGCDSDSQELFNFDVGNIDVVDKEGKYIITKGTPIKFNVFRFGGNDIEKYMNTQYLKLEVSDAEKLAE